MYIDRWYVGLFMLLKAKWVFLLYGSPCIQIMGGLINLHTKHPFMTKSEFAWAKAMHTCTGRHIKTCDRVNLSDNFLLALLPVSHISKLILDSMFKSRQTMWGKWWELLWSRFVSRRTTKRPLTDKFLSSSLDRFPRWKFQPGGRKLFELNEWGSGGVGPPEKLPPSFPFLFWCLVCWINWLPDFIYDSCFRTKLPIMYLHKIHFEVLPLPGPLPRNLSHTVIFRCNLYHREGCVLQHGIFFGKVSTPL